MCDPVFFNLKNVHVDQSKLKTPFRQLPFHRLKDLLCVIPPINHHTIFATSELEKFAPAAISQHLLKKLELHRSHRSGLLATQTIE